MAVGLLVFISVVYRKLRLRRKEALRPPSWFSPGACRDQLGLSFETLTSSPAGRTAPFACCCPKSASSLSQLGALQPLGEKLGNDWQCYGLSHWEGALLASHGEKPRMLLSI